MNDEFKNKKTLAEGAQNALRVNPTPPKPGGGINLRKIVILSSAFSLVAATIGFTSIIQGSSESETLVEMSVPGGVQKEQELNT